MAAIVPGQLRKLETVFEVVGLQVLGVSSVKSDTDHWLIDSCVKVQESCALRGATCMQSYRNMTCARQLMFM